MENTLTQISNSLYHQLVASAEDKLQVASASEPQDLSQLRKKTLQQFKKLGFPSVKVEDWKYTNLTGFLKDDFDVFNRDDESITFNKELIAKAAIPGLDCYTIVTINGKYSAAFSDRVDEKGIEVDAIHNAYTNDAFAKHFGQYIDTEKNSFAALNTALFNDGLFINVKDKAVIQKHIHVIHINTANANLFIQPRQLFVVGAFAQLGVIETYITIDDNASAFFINSVAEIIIGENAKMDHYQLQSGDAHTRYVQQTEVHQQTSSLYNNFKITLPGTGLVRNNHNLALDGVNTESHLYGIYIGEGKQLVDNHTVVDHRQPNCFSNELYKGVLKDESTGVFNGKIFVRQPAQKTNAFQKNNNLVLGAKAIVDSKPQLEIFADDVKCSHGSTIGQFNEEALFYLKARGIGEEKARALLIHAFVFDVTDKIPVPEIQVHINGLIEEGLKTGSDNE